MQSFSPDQSADSPLVADDFGQMVSGEFQIPYESLLNMLGVRREAVNESERNLQQKHF